MNANRTTFTTTPAPDNSEQPGARPAATSPRAWEYAVVLLLSLALYLVSMAPGVLWQDNGLAQVRVVQRDVTGILGLALSHPLFYVTAIAFQGLPFESSAFKTNLVAPLFGALTVANLYWLLRQMTGRGMAAACGAIALAVSHAFWQHCAMPEVYTISTALLTAELLALWQFERTGRARWIGWLFFANGLSLSNHNLALLSLACYGLLVLWLLAKRVIKVSVFGLSAGAWLLGAGLYLGLVLRMLFSGAGARETLKSALVGVNFVQNVFNFSDLPRLAVKSVLFLGLDFPTPAALLAFVGLAVLTRLPQRRFAVTAAGLLAIHLLWAVHYNVPDQFEFFVPSLVLIALLIGLGAASFLSRHGRAWSRATIAAVLLPVLVYAVLPPLARAANFSLGAKRDVPFRDTYAYFLRPWQTGYDGPERFVQALCKDLPSGAVLLADGTTVRPIHYAQVTHTWNEAIRVYPRLGEPEGIWPDEAAFRDDLAGGRVYVVTPQSVYAPEWLVARYQFEPAGPVFRVQSPPPDAAGE